MNFMRWQLKQRKKMDQQTKDLINKEINNSDIFIIPKARHMASYEKSDVINEKIDKFLNI